MIINVRLHADTEPRLPPLHLVHLWRGLSGFLEPRGFNLIFYEKILRGNYTFSGGWTRDLFGLNLVYGLSHLLPVHVSPRVRPLTPDLSINIITFLSSCKKGNYIRRHPPPKTGWSFLFCVSSTTRPSAHVLFFETHIIYRGRT